MLSETRKIFANACWWKRRTRVSPESITRSELTLRFKNERIQRAATLFACEQSIATTSQTFPNIMRYMVTLCITTIFCNRAKVNADEGTAPRLKRSGIGRGKHH